MQSDVAEKILKSAGELYAGPEYWDRLADAHTLLSNYCSFSDWQNILRSIAAELAEIRPRDGVLRVLDIGCGEGYQMLSILKYLIESKTEIHEIVLDAVEPGLRGRENIKRIIAPREQGGWLSRVLTRADELENPEYDAVLFMHSTYYFPDLNQKMNWLYRSLRPGGKMISLVLPDSSPFFMGEKNHPWTTEDILRCHAAIAPRARFAAKKLQSRFLHHRLRRHAESAALDDQWIELIKLFFRQHAVSNAEFLSQLEQLSSENRHGLREMDFGDDLLVFQKPG